MEEIIQQKYLIVSLHFLSSDLLLPIVYAHTHSSLWRKLQQQSRWNCVSELAVWQLPCSVCVHMAHQHSFSREHPCSLHSLWGARCEHPRKLCGLCGHHHWRKHGNNRSVVIPSTLLCSLSVVVLCCCCCCCLGASTLWMFSAGRFCGFAPPSNITIPGNTVVIRFLSNRANQQSGFRGYWTTDPSVIPTLPPSPPNRWDNITIGKYFLWISKICDRGYQLFNEVWRNKTNTCNGFSHFQLKKITVWSQEKKMMI